jgi:regulatory protein
MEDRILKGSPADAKRSALKLLSYRPRSRKEMLERLKKKGFDSGHITQVITVLENAGLINDKALASDLLAYSMERKYLGKKGIRMFLIKRGIERELIDRTLSTLPPELEERTAHALVEKKIKTLGNIPRNVVKKRLWGMLQRRGFPFEVINRAVNLILREESPEIPPE